MPVLLRPHDRFAPFQEAIAPSATVAKKVFVFDHIPKCAGSSMHDMLAACAPDYTIIDSACELIDYAEKVANTEGGGAFYAGGHAAYGLHELLPRSCRVFYYTLLRDPFEVAWSYYKYHKTIGLMGCGSFVDYLYDNPCVSISRFLGGSYEQALVRLESYAYIGFVDRLDKSLHEISSLLGLPLTDFPHRNATSGMAREAAAIDLSPLREFAEDFKIYAHFRRRPNEAKPRAPSAPARAAATYAQRNRTLSRFFDRSIGLTELSQALEQERDPHAVYFIACVLAKANCALNDTAFRKIVSSQADRILTCLNPAQVNSQARYELVLGVLQDLLANIRYDKQSIVLQNAVLLLQFLASTSCAREQGLSPQLLENAVALHPYDAHAWMSRALFQRQHNDPRAALASLERVPLNQRWTKYCNERLVTNAAANKGALPVQEVEQTPHQRALEFLIRNFTQSKRRLISTLGEGPILVIRSGPLPLLDDLLASLDHRRFDVLLLLQKSLAGVEKYRRYERFFIDDGWFDPQRAFKDRERLAATPVRHVVCLCSEFSALSGLQNFLVFCDTLQAESASAYMMSNLFVEKGLKSLVPLD